jgi:hypothetical protein
LPDQVLIISLYIILKKPTCLSYTKRGPFTHLRDTVKIEIQWNLEIDQTEGGVVQRNLSSESNKWKKESRKWKQKLEAVKAKQTESVEAINISSENNKWTKESRKGKQERKAGKESRNWKQL